MARRRTAPLLAAAIASAVIVAFAAPPAWAYWSATGSAAASVTAAVVATPTTLPCQSMPGLVPYARYSWNAVPGATQYRITVRNADGTVTWTPVTGNPTTATHFDLTTGLLGGLDSRLNAYLLDNQPVYVSVQALHPSGWVSAVSAGQTMYRSGLLPGVLGGTKCTL